MTQTERHQASAAMALDHALNALAADPDGRDALIQIVTVLLRARRHQEARVLAQHLRECHATDADGCQLFAMVLEACGETEAALSELEACLLLDPTRWPTREALAQRWKQRGQLLRAIELIEQGIAVNDRPRGRKCLGLLRIDSGDLEAATEHLSLAHAGMPDDVQVLYNLGWVEKARGHVNLSEEWLRTALRHDPESEAVRFNLAQALLAQGKDAEGWGLYEARLDCEAMADSRPPDPRWQGESDPQLHLVVTFEQGIGDLVMFGRWLSAARSRVGRLSLIVKPRLRGFASSLAGVDEVLVERPGVGKDQRFAAVGSLPHFLGATDRMPNQGRPYLVDHPAPSVPLAAFIASSDQRRVGLAWQGNPNYPHDAERSLPLSCFAPLAELPGIDLWSLQQGAGKDQLAQIGFRVQAPPCPADDDDAFRDTRAALLALDALVTSDSAIAHIAGAMGVRTHLLLSHAPEWRWGISGARTPWYPSVTLHRQRVAGDWSRPILEIAEDLRPLGLR